MHIIGASYDSVELNAKFANDNGFQYPLLCDTEKQVGTAYGAGDSNYPKRIAIVVDAEGNVSHFFASVSAGAFPGQLLGELSEG